MKFSLITCTRDRPEAFKLCEKYVARQTMQYHEWFVLDDGYKPAKCTMGQNHLIYGDETRGHGSLILKLRKLLEYHQDKLTGDAIVFVEDDDWYSPDYLRLLNERFQGHAIVGEGYALYYNVMTRHWHMHNNDKHCSLAQTAVARSAWTAFPKLLTSLDPFLDVRLWGDMTQKHSKFIFTPETLHPNPSLVGIKGMYGTIGGYGSGHNGVMMKNPDPEMKFLRRIIGSDAENYCSYYDADIKRVIL